MTISVGQVAGAQTNGASSLTTSGVSTAASGSSFYVGVQLGPDQTANFNGYISGTTLTVELVQTGTIRVGMVLKPVQGDFSANTTITALGTGSGGLGTYTVNNSQSAGQSTFTGSIATTVLTIAGSVTGTAAGYGMYVTGSGLTAGTLVTGNGTGSGGAGTYNINHTQTVGSESMVGYEQITGTVFPTVAVTDSNSNSYSQIATTLQNTGDAPPFVVNRYLAINGTGGSGHTVTATPSAGDPSMIVWLVEIVGGDTGSPLDQSAQATNYANPWTPGNIVLGAVPATDELLIAMVNEDQYPGTSITESNSFTVQTPQYYDHTTYYVCGAIATKVVTSNGTYTADFTTTGNPSGNFAACIDSFFGASPNINLAPPKGALVLTGQAPVRIVGTIISIPTAVPG